MKCPSCGSRVSPMRPHPEGAHCPDCAHPYNTVAPNPFTNARHYDGCPRIDSASNVPSRKAAARMQQRHRQNIEDRQKGVPMPPAVRSSYGPPPTIEYAHWAGCREPDCVRCNNFEQVIDLGYDQLTGA